MRHDLRTSWVLLIELILSVLASPLSAKPAEPIPAAATQPVAATAFSVPIDVTGLPADASYAAVSCLIDFNALLKGTNVQGLVDEHSIRLYSVSGKLAVEVPVQFTPAMQPRLKTKNLLPGTSPSVSYGSEFRPGNFPAGPRVAGELTWGVTGFKQEKVRHYRLEFAAPKEGRSIQVPFNPQNFRAFDNDGKATPLPQFPVMQLHPLYPFDGVVHLSNQRELLATYHIGPTTQPAPGGIKRPFVYPVNGPDGIPLTEFGKPHDPTNSHAHHYSLWIAHNSVNGKDFWSEKGGSIISEQLASMEDGPVFCRIVQKTKWMFEGADLMHEQRTLTAYDTPEGFRILDLAMELTPSGKDPVELGKTTFGFLAARVAQSMTVFDGGGEIMNSRGDRNEPQAHLKHADWIDQSGPIAPGKWGGIALFPHPQNSNHPCGFHCRNDGWACASFNMDAPYTLMPGKPLHLKYRILLHRGDAKTGNVQALYDGYAAQPVVQVGEVKEGK